MPALPLSALLCLVVTATPPALPTPADVPFPGEIVLEVDARDVERRIIHVQERISGLPSEAVLLYPKWMPGKHAPEGAIDRLAGLRITAGGRPVAWSRDTLEVFAFRVKLPPGVAELTIAFDYLSPTSAKVGPLDVSRELAVLDWSQVLLYPAGHRASQVPVTASLELPEGWSMATALEPQPAGKTRARFSRVSLESLIDSPVFAGRHFSRTELDGSTGVFLDVFADRPDLLRATPAAIAAHRALVQQAGKLYGSRHYRHYDFLLGLSDQVASRGLEHHQSSENVTDPSYFSEWDKTVFGRDLLAHEYTHSWNGKFRRPADLWTPSYEVPMQNSLLWVYEGQTQYWGFVLAARAGLWSRAQALDAWAGVAAYHATAPGRRWRPLQDTTNDEIMNPRRPMSWPSWQRFEDYYDEGALIWLEADTLIRERSGGKRSLDDFARAFFGVADGQIGPLTYTFDDLVQALNAIEPYDWSAFLRERVDSVDRPAPLAGLARGGYRLVFSDQPGDLVKAEETQQKRTVLRHSIGVDIEEKEGLVFSVVWDSPAYRAGLSEGMQILAVNGISYSGELLKRIITVGKGGSEPMVLILKHADRYSVARIDYHDGLRYPHLERDPKVRARLDEILTPR